MTVEPSPNDPLIAYVYGDAAPPDFGALAAMGFQAVCLDSSAPWFRPAMIAAAEVHGLLAVAHPMAYAPRREGDVLNSRARITDANRASR